MAGVDFTTDIGAIVGARLGDFGRFAVDAADVLAQARRDLQADLLADWPVDTGTSLRNWTNRIDGMVWIFRNPVEYVEWVFEAGTYSGPESTPRIADELERLMLGYVDDVTAELRGLLARARREQGRQIPLFGRATTRGPSASRLIGGAIFRGAFDSFQQPGRGARQRLRERFPNEPIGRATTRRRDRTRAR